MEREPLISSSAGVAWQASKSQVLGTPSAPVELNTPKILELDVNRMMISQTDVRYVDKQISAPAPEQKKPTVKNIPNFVLNT